MIDAHTKTTCTREIHSSTITTVELKGQLCRSLQIYIKSKHLMECRREMLRRIEEDRGDRGDRGWKGGCEEDRGEDGEEDGGWREGAKEESRGEEGSK